MERTLVTETTQKVGEQVMLRGWVQAIRDKGGVAFVVLRDVSGTLQIVVSTDTPNLLELVRQVSLESVIEVVGTVKVDERAPLGVEIQGESLEVLSEADPHLPIPVVTEKGGEETEATTRFDWRWIDLRKPERQKIFKVWTALEEGMREYFTSNRYFQLYMPSLMSSPSESGSEVFEVQYFEGKAFLAQSPQFYKQLAMAAGFERVFMVGPVFRAEQSFTSRHMTEFTGWDFELSFIESHHDVMAEEEKMLVQAFEKAKALVDPELVVPTIPFPKLTMVEAKEKLQKRGIPSEKEHDLSPEEERVLSELVKEEYGHEFVFVTDWHISARPFYHMRHEDMPDRTKSFDLLYKGLEITTGAQREHRYDVLKKQAEEKGMDIPSIQYYLDFFRYGCPPHGGAGIGPGRIIKQLLDIANVKEVTFLPRDVRRLNP